MEKSKSAQTLILLAFQAKRWLSLGRLSFLLIPAIIAMLHILLFSWLVKVSA